ncbi:hypothetical protein [Aestuariimicrobium kwangyangense]|uniref:LpxL/LpxP family acyltransferase n=1 Tax=Aestuariimicrobium kwangyangense TaxID=396389 RepID=UPI0003B4D240|nr:hypothetical protein [Aestuariimicrobium kwangyangense]
MKPPPPGSPVPESPGRTATIGGAELRSRAVAAGLRAAGGVPWPVWRPVAELTGTALALHPNRGLRQWQANVTALTGRPVGRSLRRRALVSWAHNNALSMRLGHFTREQVISRIVMDPEQEERLRTVSATRGAVVALPHMGSWDLAGAWACAVGMPVSTVAEQLGRSEFELFLRERRRLGFTVHGHRDPLVGQKLIADARAKKLVCLLVDRNLSRGGVPVEWPAPRPVRSLMPIGPAHVALESGSMLLALSSTFEGGRLRLQLSDPIEAEPGARSRVSRYQSMMQQVCVFFHERITERPEDWHMLQPMFAEGES